MPKAALSAGLALAPDLLLAGVRPVRISRAVNA
jgi:hypothetical protein